MRRDVPNGCFELNGKENGYRVLQWGSNMKMARKKYFCEGNEMQ